MSADISRALTDLDRRVERAVESLYYIDATDYECLLSALRNCEALLNGALMVPQAEVARAMRAGLGIAA